MAGHPNLGQFQHLYPENWETFFANAGAVQSFGVNDKTTGEYLSHGLATPSARSRWETSCNASQSQLREVNELERNVARESGKKIVFRNGALPMMISRVNYDRIFPKPGSISIPIFQLRKAEPFSS